MEYTEKKTDQYINMILVDKRIQLFMLYFLLLFIPFLIQGPQVLVGILINALLIIGISQFNIKQILPSLILPSLSVYIYGSLFGSATSFLLYLIPVISISNLIYVAMYKSIKRKEYAVPISSILKVAFLFSFTFLLFKTIGIPEILLTTMGPIQLITAIVGGYLGALAISKR